jgi:hypothetical protein
MVDYVAKASSAQRLLAKFGQTVTLKLRSSSAYDLDTLEVAVTEVEELRKAVLLDFDRINFGVTEQDGTMIQKGDRRCLMDAKGTRPQVKDVVVVGTEEYPIHMIKILSPAGTDVLYDMLLRK